MKNKIYMISIRPRFAYRIFSGLKKFELRRWIGIKPEENSIVIVYVSGSVKAIIGEFCVGRVFLDKPNNLKKILSNIDNTGIGSEDFSYIENAEYALAIEVLNPVLYIKPIKLEHIKRIIPYFEPPLSIREINYSEPVYELIIRKARVELFKRCFEKNNRFLS